MEPTSPPKHAASLGERLNKRIEEDASAVVSATQKKLDDLAKTSSERLSESLNTTISDIESRLKSLRKLSLRMWIVSLATGAVLTLGVLIGLGLYASWELHQVRSLKAKQEAIQTAMQKLPPPFRVIQRGGKWYLVAPQINPNILTYTTDAGKKEDALRIP